MMGVANTLLAVILGWLAVSYKAPAIEQDILTRTSEVVSPLNAEADVLVDGRFVTVRGPEPSEESKSGTLAAADDVWGALGPWDGLWVPAAASAAEFFRADKMADGTLVLTGSVPSEEAKAALEAAAAESFPGTIDNRITVSGAAGPSALQDIGPALESLGTLESGSLVALPDGFRLMGRTSDRAAADAANALAAAEPAKWGVVVEGPQAAAASASASAPAHFNAAKAPNGNIVVNGEVASEEDRRALIDRLQQMAGTPTVIDNLSVRGEGLPDDWNDRITTGFAALRGLDWGSLSLEGAQSYLYGSGGADRIAPIEEALDSGWTSRLLATTADPDAAAANEHARRCNNTMAQVMRGNAIEFATASAEIAQAGMSLIDQVAEAAIPCLDAGLVVTISGHTDDQGDDEANLTLSQQRAEAVKSALAARGLPEEDITARGFGETMPIASNETEEGRAHNRRITFDWFVR